jgi:uncharacterized peroxidase-related enzyme
VTPFPVHTIETAPEASRPLLETERKTWGFVPTLHATLAESPIALEAYITLFTLAGQSTLSPEERQVVFLAVSVLHGCEYCVAGHTYLARSAGMPEPTLQALRGRRPIADSPRHQALRSFCEAVVRERGHAGDSAVDAFIAAGFTRRQVLEVVTLIATKTISNYTNHLTHTPQETFMSDPALKWTAADTRAGIPA